MKTKSFFQSGIKVLITLLAFVVCGSSFFNTNAQNIAISDLEGYTPEPTSMLDVYSTTKGMLVPRVALVSTTNPISGTKPNGLLVWNTSTEKPYLDPGFYYWSDKDWVKVGSSGLNFKNGLTQSDYNVKLGGTLTGTTTLTLGSTSLNINLAGTGDFNVQDNGTSALFVRDNGKVGIGSSTPIGKLDVKADGSFGVDDPLFCVVNNDNDTVFAVYPEGVRINVSDGAKGAKGGFAVGGFAGKGNGNEFLVVSPDSIRMYVERGVKGSKGGFAVGGFSAAKGDPKPMEFFRVTPDSVRIYLDETAKGKGSKGGFAVGGFSALKDTITDFLRVTSESTRVSMEGDGGFKVGKLATGTTESFLDLTPQNYFIGHESGQQITNGKYNTFFGFESGYSTEGGIEVSPGQWEGCNNIFIGYQSGYNNITGYKNVFIGYKSGANNTSGEKNIFIGNESGEVNTTGGYNSFIGYNAGILNFSGMGNTFLGSNCGFYNSTGGFNTCLGSHSGEYLDACSANTFIGTYSGHGGGSPGGYPSVKITGNSNTFLGYRSGFNNLSGSNNTYLGYQSGHENANGSGNVFIGSEAGYNEPGSDRLYIDNTDTSTPLIYGEFDNDLLVFNANVGIGNTSTTAKLYVSAINDESAIRTYNTDDSGTNYGVIAMAGSTGTNGARAIYSRVSRSGSGQYYSGYFLDSGTGGIYDGLYADYRTGGAIDLAEYIYDTYNNLEKADVVVIDANNDESVVHNSEPYSANVAGIVSTQPHLVMGMELIKDEETGERIPGINAVQLSLAGRVPVKVTDENGPIKRGDFLTSSSIPGHAMKWTLLNVNKAKDFEGLKAILAENERRRNTVIGKALEEHTSGTGKIVVLISLQ